MALVIGLTGGIGSGKSALAERLAARGAGLVDADAVAHQLTAPGGAAIAALRAEFGDEAITPEGALDRAWMRRRAFADRNIKARLEAILHPLIGAEIDRQIAAAAARAPYVIVAIPLLVESGRWRERLGRVLVVDCAESTQLARVLTRPGLTEDTARAIMSVQAGRDERLAVADDVVVNEGDLAALDEHALRLDKLYRDLAAAA